jgi:uncharacterized membrane protein HdeD (DUF308 family)
MALAGIARGSSLLNQWWALIIRGVLAILFGVLAVAWPHITLIVLLALFAAYAIADGITSIVAAIRNKSYGWVLFGGILSLAIGIMTLVWPGAATLALVILIGSWAIVRGVFDIAAAIALRETIRYEWLLVLSGVASIIFGFLLVLFPIVGIFALIGLIAGFSIVIGALLIAAGFRQRRIKRDLGPDTAAAPA